MSAGAARDSQLRSRLRELTQSRQISISEAASQDSGVNIALVGERPQRSRHCIVLSTGSAEDAQRQALETGAAALITPATTATELRAIIAAVHHGFAVIPSQLAPRIAGRLQSPPDMAPITALQRQLLELLATGHTLKEASATVGLSERHARRHLRQLWDTLKTPNQTAGIVQATRYGLIKPLPSRGSPPSLTTTRPTKIEKMSRLHRHT